MKRAHALLCICLLVAACSSSGGSGSSSSLNGTVIGPAGGTVTGPNGAAVVIPAGALLTETTISIEASSAGAPALPGGFASYGSMYAFTPHGLQFARPVTLTVPFDPALPSGATPMLYKTNTQGQWELISSTTVAGSALTGQVSSFSWANVGAPLPQPLLRNDPTRYWAFGVYLAGEQAPQEAGSDIQVGGVLSILKEFGPLIIDHDGYPSERALGEVFSSESGRTYWVLAQAPSGDPTEPTSPIGASTTLKQYQSFVKTQADATLKFTITKATISPLDQNSPNLAYHECPWGEPCDVMFGQVQLEAEAFSRWDGTFFKSGGTALVKGSAGRWSYFIGAFPSTSVPLWLFDNFDINSDLSGDGSGSYARLELRAPITHSIDLSSIAVCEDTSRIEACEQFTLRFDARAYARNRRGGESDIFAFLRDPLDAAGATVEYTGLVATNDPQTTPPPDDNAPVPCTGGPNPAAGTLQFEASSFATPEAADMPVIVVTRAGGSQGAVSVTLATSDGSAISGADYAPLVTTVYFGDGDLAPRLVPLELVLDETAEPDKTMNLALSTPGGCATLGVPSTAVLIILDDDRPAPVNPTFSVGGTVSGLVGTGLVLEEVRTGSRVTPGNGTFTFSYAFPNASAYEARIASQPTSPPQICTLANPTGTIANANVTNVAISCSTPAANGALDSSFGSGGKVTSALVSSITGNVGRAVALQGIGPNAGKIVVLANMALIRFHPDGRVDESFGSSGVVPVVFAGTLNNETSDLAIDANDRIIIAGWTRANNTTLNYDFAINRYDTNGILDPTFDGDGRVTIDFFGDVDRAHRVIVDSTGRIVVAGQTTYLLPPPNPLAERDTSFVVTRLNTDGTRDNSLLSALAFPDYSIPYGLAISPTGKIVLGGSTAASGTAVSDAALARFGVDGLLDSDNDSDPSVWFGVDASGRGADDLLYATNDQIVDLVVTGDDRIVGAVRTPNVNMSNPYTGANFKYNFLLVEFQDSFGDAAGQGADIYYTEVPIGLGDDRANALVLQGDGKFVVAGGASSTVSNDTDFGIVRFNTDRTVDTAFGSNGILTVDFFGGVDEAKDVVVQPDGKLVVVGTVRNGSSWNLGLTRIVP